MGDWTYYTTILTFEQVDKFVSKIDDQIHNSESLKDLIQRSITNNYISIKDYIINQKEMFFNSLVLAVYDDYPNWKQIEYSFSDDSFYQMGLLEFPSSHKIFPVDGQHRVEGIKEALKADPSLKYQQITAIFIGHKNDSEGKQRTRRLFTTLNRYAKPVKLDDIIALDEDDIVAILTRKFLEEYDLFTGKRVVYAKQKAIPTNNKNAITSIITLYYANYELFKAYRTEMYGKKPSNKNITELLKFRPNDGEINNFEGYLLTFWDAFKNNLTAINRYLRETNNFSEEFRNRNGGNLLFRPIGLLPFVKACIQIKQTTNCDFEQILGNMDNLCFDIAQKPWRFVVWDPVANKMIMNSSTITQLLIIYLYDEKILNENELTKLKQGYASKISYEDEIENVLDGIK